MKSKPLPPPLIIGHNGTTGYAYPDSKPYETGNHQRVPVLVLSRCHVWFKKGKEVFFEHRPHEVGIFFWKCNGSDVTATYSVGAFGSGPPSTIDSRTYPIKVGSGGTQTQKKPNGKPGKKT